LRLKLQPILKEIVFSDRKPNHQNMFGYGQYINHRCVCVCVCVYLWLQWCCHKYRSEEYIWRYLDDPLQDLLHLLSTKQAMGMKKEKNKKKMQIWRRWITRWGNSSRRGCWERRHRIVLLSTTSKDNPCPPPSIDLMHLSCITRLLLAIGPPGFTKGG
jgi:hypothetical protein